LRCDSFLPPFALRLFVHQLSETVEAVFPILSVTVNPFMGVLHTLCTQAAKPPLRIRSAIDEAGIFENTKMLRYRRKRNVERFRKFTNCRLALRQTRENGPTGRVGEGGKCFR
jgi:hypothetical protein